MELRERIAAYVAVGALVALAMLIHVLTSGDGQGDFEAASAGIGWSTEENIAIGVGDVCGNDGALWGPLPIERRDDGPTCPSGRRG